MHNWFLGEYTPSLTEGSRIALPKKIRDSLDGSRVVLTRGFENCIAGYRKDTWEKQANERASQSTDNLRVRQLHRYLFSGALELSVDRQGRVVLPANLMEYANISEGSDSAVVIGVGDHFEIWDKGRWKQYLTKISEEVGKE